MRTALVVVDMCNDFLDGVLANPAATAIVDPIASLARRARAADGWIVVYASDAHLPDDVELTVFPPHAMAGTRGAAVVDRLTPEPGDLVVDKRWYSAFTGTTLGPLLRAGDVGRLVLVGQHTDCCIRHTAYDAFTQGYGLVVCPDATAVFEPDEPATVAERQGRALDYLRAYYGAHLVAADEVA